MPGVDFAHFEPAWATTSRASSGTYLNSRGPVLENGQTHAGGADRPLVLRQRAADQRALLGAVQDWRASPTDVLIQAFERRVLTYTPANPRAFQVEMGNVGRHYYDWRYGAGH